MKHLALPLAACAVLAGCATYVPYDYPAYPVQTVPGTTQPVYVYPSYAYPYAYPYSYGYPYAYGGAYWSPSIWISGSYRSGGHHWQGARSHGARPGHRGTRPHR